LADLWGRKRIMAIGLASQAVVSLIYLTVSDPIVFVVLRFAEGLTSASVLPAARALVADATPPEERGRAYGIFGAFLNAGFVLGPALGGVFAAFGYASAFVGSCVFRLLALILVLTLVKGGGATHPEARARARAVARRALFTLPLVGTYILTFGDNLYFGFDLTLMPLWLRHNVGAPVAAIGLGYAVWAVPNVLGSPFGGRLADRARRSTMILIFGLAQVPMYIAYGSFPVLWLLIIIFGLHGIVYALMGPSVDATLATASPPDARARAQSVYSAVGIVSAFIAANVLSWLYGINFRLPLFTMGAGFGLCVLVGWSLIRVSERRSAAVVRGEKPVAAS
jgi:MFS family permease